METINTNANKGPIAGAPSSKPMAPKLFTPSLKYNADNHIAYWRGLQTLFTSYGPTKSKVVLLTEPENAPPLTAGIDPKSWNCEFHIRSNLEFKNSPALQTYLETLNITDPVGELLQKVGMHEIGHWEFPRGKGFGCPYDNPTYYSSFVEPIHDEVVKSRKFPSGMQDGITRTIANAVMDVINNCNVADIQKQKGGHYAGQSLFWYLQGQEVGPYSAEYGLFVRLNLACFGTPQDTALLEGFMPDDKRVENALGRLAPLFTEQTVFSKQQWETLARAYAREAIPLMDARPPQHQYSADSPSSGSSSQGQEGNQSQSGSDQSQESKKENSKEGGQGEKKGGSQGGKQEGEKKEGGQGEKKGGSQGGKQEGKKEKKKKSAQGGSPSFGYAPLGSELSDEDKQAIMGGRKAGQGIPFYLKTDEALDAYLTQLAKRIPIRAKGPNPTASFPILPTLISPFDPDEHSADDIIPGKFFADPIARKLVQAVGSNLMDLNIPILKSKKNLPDFFFILLDSSISMMGDVDQNGKILGKGDTSIVPWGDASYYHQGLLAFYGLLHFFQKEGLMHHIKFKGAIFSDVTLGAQDLESLKKLILNPATGVTRLDLAKVIEMHKGRTGALFPLVSDGEIGNWDSIKNDFIKLARANQFFMIQIGGSSQASRDLADAGLYVRHISSASDLAKMAIDLTAKAYDSSIASMEEDERKKYNLR